MKRGKKIMLVIIGVLVPAMIAIQFVPIDRSNPEVTAPLVADAAVLSVLRTSCFDCHSNETIWPWYSFVAPVSWQVAHHVEEGREHLNFSTWGSFDADKQAHMAEEAWEEASKGEMPEKSYLSIHRDAKLDRSALTVLEKWAAGLQQEGGEESQPETELAAHDNDDDTPDTEERELTEDEHEREDSN